MAPEPAFHRYTELPSATATCGRDDQQKLHLEHALREVRDAAIGEVMHQDYCCSCARAAFQQLNDTGYCLLGSDALDGS